MPQISMSIVRFFTVITFHFSSYSLTKPMPAATATMNIRYMLAMLPMKKSETISKTDNMKKYMKSLLLFQLDETP